MAAAWGWDSLQITLAQARRPLLTGLSDFEEAPYNQQREDNLDSGLDPEEDKRPRSRLRAEPN